MKRLILVMAALFVGGTALAQAPGGGAPGGGRAGGAGAAGGGMPDNATIFANNDANKDGVITKEEADKAGLPLSQNWTMFDTNSDGKVTAEELDAVRGNLGAGGAGRGGPGARAGGAGGAGGAGRGGPGARAGGAGGAPAASDDDDDDDDK